jgi:hypothetical protein
MDWRNFSGGISSGDWCGNDTGRGTEPGEGREDGERFLVMGVRCKKKTAGWTDLLYPVLSVRRLAVLPLRSRYPSVAHHEEWQHL